MRDHTGYSLPLPVHTPQDLELELQEHSRASIVEDANGPKGWVWGWPQASCRGRARVGGESGSWGPRLRGVPFTSTCRILDTASPTGKSKGPRATTFRDTAAAAMGTTEKPTGRAEPTGTCTCWASPPPPARHSPSTGDTWTLTWGQEDREGQSPSPVRLPTPHLPHPLHHRALSPQGASRSDLYPGSCRGLVAARAAQSGGQSAAGGGACGIHGTLGVWLG